MTGVEAQKEVENPWDGQFVIQASESPFFQQITELPLQLRPLSS